MVTNTASLQSHFRIGTIGLKVPMRHTRCIKTAAGRRPGNMTNFHAGSGAEKCNSRADLRPAAQAPRRGPGLRRKRPLVVDAMALL
jgi:hypothetical protein